MRAGDIAKIKLSGFISGITGEWVVEKTLFGWTLIGDGQANIQADILAFMLTYFTTTSQDDYKQLYSLGVLGLEDRHGDDQTMICQELKEQLLRKSDGTYRTRLPWKEGHNFLPGNKCRILVRLYSQL